MNNYKKIAIIAVMVIIIGVMGCGQDVKPTDDIMKRFIMGQVSGHLVNNPAISDIKLETFNITNGFFSRMPGGGGESRTYCIEVNYRISYIETIDNTMINRDAINRLKGFIEFTEGSINGRLDSIKDWEIDKAKAPAVAGTPGLSLAPKAYYEAIIKEAVDIINYDRNEIAKAKANIETVKKKPDIVKENKVITGNEKFSFKKRGDRWYGYSGWNE